MPADVSTGPTSNMRRRRGEARTYDFRRPVRLAREHAHLLRVAMQTFGRQSTTVLTTSLRAVCQIGAPQIEELSYDEFLSSMKDHSVCAVLNLEPWSGKALMTFDLATLLTMIDHQLGGMGSEKQPERPLTDIEQALVRQLITRLLNELAYALEPITKGVRPQLLTLEADARFVQAAASTDPVVVATMDLAVGQRESQLSLCLPYAMLSPALDLATHHDDGDQTRVRTTAALQTQRRLTDVDVDVAIRFEPLRMSSQSIGRLAVGDVLAFPHRTTTPMAVTSASTVFAHAIPGASGRQLAVLIVSAR
ncbi:MAG: flagellar motor switch protein FliM [Kineosporiaceae bacterium]|nr:flagellar motor switch protein FliM [Kineosporiaceae bacterium]